MRFKKGIIAVYHDINCEARSMEMLQCMEMLCDQCIYVSYAEPAYESNATRKKTKSGAFRYFYFLTGAVRCIRKENPDLILLHDNMCAPILKWLVEHDYHGEVVYDSSELYVAADQKKREVKHAVTFQSKVKTFLLGYKIKLANRNIALEAAYIRNVDVVIAANVERAKYMEANYGLSDTPLVYDNIHRIDAPIEMEQCDQKFHGFFKEGCFHILYAGGIAAERRTFDLVTAVCKASESVPVKLLIAGRAEISEKERIDKYLAQNNIEIVSYLGYLTRGELKYLLQRSQVSVVTFTKDTFNNLYCASGKAYESLFEGVPLIASTNPPLERICKTYDLGVSSDDFVYAILELYAHYEKYRKNVASFIKSLNYEERVPKLAEKLEMKLAEGKKKGSRPA